MIVYVYIYMCVCDCVCVYIYSMYTYTSPDIYCACSFLSMFGIDYMRPSLPWRGYATAHAQQSLRSET